MMLYAIKDKLDGFTAPIPFGDERVAIRWYLTMCEQNIDMAHNRDDFELWYMGEFEKNTGEIKSDLRKVEL